MTIKQDNLCFPRSVITVIAYFKKFFSNKSVVESKLWNLIRRETSTEQKKKVLEFVSNAGVDVPEANSNVSHIKKIQEYLAHESIAIKVYEFSSFGQGEEPFFDSTNLVTEIAGVVLLSIIILHYNTNHYRPVINVKGALCKEFCEVCHKGVKFLQSHRCSCMCSSCLNAKIPCMLKNEIKCNDCKQTLFFTQCYNHHKSVGSFHDKYTVCDRVKFCLICNKTYFIINENFENECGIAYCNN